MTKFSGPPRSPHILERCSWNVWLLQEVFHFFMPFLEDCLLILLIEHMCISLKIANNNFSTTKSKKFILHQALVMCTESLFWVSRSKKKKFFDLLVGYIKFEPEMFPLKSCLWYDGLTTVAKGLSYCNNKWVESMKTTSWKIKRSWCQGRCCGTVS